MAGTRSRALGACALAVTLAAIALPQQAAATSWEVGDFKYVKKTGFLPAAGSMETTTEGVKLGCGNGWEIVSGGGEPTGLPGHGGLASSGFGGTRHWFTEARHLDEEKVKFHGYATCIRDVFVDSATHVEGIAAGPTSEGSLVDCPTGLFTLGGGVRTTGDTELWSINSLAPLDTGDGDLLPDDGWTVFMAYGGPAGNDFLVDVTCGQDLPEYAAKSLTLPVDVSGRKKTVRCPGGTHVTGGAGFISGNSLEAGLLATRPIDLGDADKAPDDGWRVRANNYQGAEKTLTVHAICL